MKEKTQKATFVFRIDKRIKDNIKKHMKKIEEETGYPITMTAYISSAIHKKLKEEVQSS